MKKIQVLLLLIMTCLGKPNPLSAQAKEYTLQDNYSGTNLEYIARDYISLLPGFSYTPSDGNTFHAQIDPALLFPPTDNTIDPTSGGMVGSIPGEFRVNPIGAATYTLPIDCPEGINNVQPKISLVYDSNGGNGYLGWGWSLSASSAITRTGSTLHHDGEISEIKLDNTDNYILDGQRLFLISGTPENPNKEFKTEIENYSQIKTKVNPQMYFEVITKEGTKLEYGSTDDSRMDALDQNRKLAWLLKRATDRNGNYILYNYDKFPEELTGEVRLHSIQYTGNVSANKAPSYTVEFQYGERPDLQYLYIGGSRTCISRVLSKIVIKKGEKIIRWYDLRYNWDPINTRLMSVQVYNGSYEKMNATSIEWGTADNSIKTDVFRPEGLYRKEQQPFWYADFNGDGRMDFATFVRGDPQSQIVFYVADNSANGFSKWRAMGLLLFPDETSSVYNDFYTIIPGDFNGDGLTDFVLVTRKKNFDSNIVYNHQLYINQGKQPGAFFTVGRYIEQPTVGLAGDFDGDRKLELVFENTSQTYRLSDSSINNLVAGQDIVWGNKAHTADFPNNKYMLDFNGDGKTDIMVLDRNGFRIYTLNKVNDKYRYQLLFSGDYPTYNTGIYFSDFNGDGKTDLITQKIAYDETDNETAIHLSTGKEFAKRLLPELKQHLTKLYPGDYNGDHRVDIAYFTASTKLTIGYFTGLKFNWNNFTLLSGVEPMNNNINADFNGDGKDEIIYNAFSNTNGNAMYSFSLGKNCEELYVNKIKDGMGKTISIDYAYTYDPSVYLASQFYLKNYPLIGLNDKLKVVKSYAVGDGTTMFTTEMKYQNGRMHLHGKGFLGFEKVTAKDVVSDIQNTTTYGYDTQYYNVFVEKQESETSGNRLISSHVFTNKREGLGKRYFPYIEEETKTDHLSGLTTTTHNDSYIEGNPGKVTITTGDIRQENIYEYTNVGSPYQNKIKSVITNKYLGSDIYSQKRTYEYDEKGNLKKEILNDNIPTEKVTTEYSDIDPYGRYKTKSITAYDGKGSFVTRSIQRTFTPSGDFIASSSNVLNEVTTYDWDETTGLLQRETNPQGLITSYQYDNWDTLKETCYPDGKRNTESRQWANESNEFNARYYTYKETSGSSPTWTWYDSLGRAIVTQSYGLNNQLISVFTQYDSQGRVWRISEPTFNNTPDTWAETRIYDPFGRPSTITTLMGKTTYAYNGLSTTIVSPNETQTTVLNTSGLTESVNTNGKSVSYTYYASGLTKTATPQGGQSITIQYDRQGNQTKLIDPDAGTIRSEYNGFGELITTVQKIHADQDSIRTEHHYDNNGLLTQIDRNGEITGYTYDTNVKSRIKSISIAGRHNQAFTYDKLGRITGTTDNIQQKIFKTAFEYDSFGRIKKGTYPSGYYILNQYDKYGNLTNVADRYNRNIWQAVDENAKGQILHENKGGKITTYEYDDRGFPTAIMAKNVIDMSYSFNAKGNLEYRTDRLTNQKEVFAYDGMNRLTNWDLYKSDALVKQNNLQFNDAGNIASKSDLGSLYMNYGEDGKGPHALTSISGVPKNFPADDLNVTYTDFKKINTLAEGDKLYTVSYGVDDQRCKTTYTQNGILQHTRYYLGNYEEEINPIHDTTQKIHYLPGNSILIIDSEGKETLYYGYADYQGSLVALATPTSVVRNGKFAYDPWGRRRNPDNWAENDNRTTWLVNRGYTGHEHLDAFGIINMNGRVYDPLTASFFSPDPYVQAPDNWMSFNRYSYCLNNPLIYTDPNGEFWWYVVAGIIGGTINVVTHWDEVSSGGFLTGLGYFGVGALSSVAGCAVGTAVAGIVGTTGILGGATVGFFSGFASGFVAGGGNALMAGDSFMEGAFNGAAAGSFSGLLSGGIFGGWSAYSQGKNVWTGEDILKGYNPFSPENSSLSKTGNSQYSTIEHPDAIKYDLSDLPPLDEPIKNQPMTPYEKGKQGVKWAIEEFKADGGTLLKEEVTIELDGVRNRFDFVGKKDNIFYLYEVKNGPTARFTPNQAINIPKMQVPNPPPFIPIGGNAAKIKDFTVGQPFTGKYLVVYRHYFKFK